MPCLSCVLGEVGGDRIPGLPIVLGEAVGSLIKTVLQGRGIVDELVEHVLLG